MKRLKTQFPIEKMSQVFGVTRSGYYRFLSYHRGKRAQEEVLLSREIERIFYEHKKRYGSPRIFIELQEKGVCCSEKRVAKIMRANKLVSKRRKKWRRRKLVAKEKKPNLINQEFKAEKKNSKWLSDITYIRTAKGWAYLCTVMDLYSRKIIGHAVKEHLKKELVVQALEQAISRRGSIENGLIFHSDQGSQYGSEELGKSLKKNKMLGSMSGKGSCYDNAPMESFFNSFKRECVEGEIFKDAEAAEKEIFNYIECYYNNKRKHSSLGYLSPVKFEEKHENSLC
jgi:transposase InsO family protein